MGKQRPAVKYYKELYVPPLVRAGNKKAVRMASTMKANAVQRVVPNNKKDFRIDRERARELGRLGGLIRQARITREEQLANAKTMSIGYQNLPAEIQREYGRRASQLRWANMTPEQREKQLAINRATLARLTELRRLNHWPFPFRYWAPSKGRGRLSSAELNEAREKKARLRKFLKATSRK